MESSIGQSPAARRFEKACDAARHLEAKINRLRDTGDPRHENHIGSLVFNLDRIERRKPILALRAHAAGY